MANSQSRITLGRYDPFRRTPSLEIEDGKIKFIPGTGAQYEFQCTEATFPPGARVECRLERGDRYFEGDHGLTLGRTLWVVEPDGGRKLLASGFALYVSHTVASRNLEKRGIPYRVVSFYKGPNGKEVETEISVSHSSLGPPVGLLLATSNLWLGALAGLFIHSVGYLIGVGTAAFLVLAIATLQSSPSSRTAFLKIISIFPSYAGGYAALVVLVRFMAAKHVGR